MKHSSSDCPIFKILELLGTKRVLHILLYLSQGEETFTGLQKRLDNLNGASLTQKLDLLKDEGYITRQVICEDPIKIRYYLTKLGQELIHKLKGLVDRANEKR